MQTVLTFDAALGRPGELRGILADYLALDRARVYRRLLMVRCTLTAVVALVVSYPFHGLSVYARWVPIGLILAPAMTARLVEVRLHARLSRRVRRAGARKS